MKIICDNFSLLEDKTADLIFEGIYLNGIFEDLMRIIRVRFLMSDDPIEVSFNDLDKFISSSWKHKSSLDRRKTVKICMLSEIDKLQLIEKEKEEIKERMKKDEACFGISEEDPFSSFIVVDDDVLSTDLDDALFHEMIHFFQWSIGKRVHDLFKKNENPIDLTNEDIKGIEKTFGLHHINAKRLVDYYLKSFEREAYYHEIFMFCRKKLPQLVMKNRTRFKWFIEIFQNKNEKSFENYYMKVKIELVNTFGLEDSLLLNREVRILMLYGYFKIGFISLKNHLLGYFDKEKIIDL